MEESRVKESTSKSEKYTDCSTFKHRENILNVSYKDIKEWKNNPITKALMKTFYKFNVYNKDKDKSIFIALHHDIKNTKDTVLHFMIKTGSFNNNSN